MTIQAFRPARASSYSVASPGVSAAAPLGVGVVRVVPVGGNVTVDVGPNPVVSANSMVIPDGAIEYFTVYQGDRLAFGGSATVSVVFMDR